jgi:glycolate oxidase iron-sulfur subunit
VKAHEKILRYDRSLDCVHCGLCLPACPTYQHTGKETASPRGRIYLMRAFAEGRLSETPENIQEIDQCLVCRACETVCPSGVQFGEMMEITRDLVETTQARGRLPRFFKRWFFRRILPYPRRLRLLASLLSLYRGTGLQAMARTFGLVHLLGKKQVLRDSFLPPIPALTQRSEPSIVNAAEGEQQAEVGFLVGCVAHELLPAANRAAIYVLQRNGCQVHCPASRPCCGALPMHFGDVEAARSLAQKTIESFAEDLDAIVVSSAGCAAAMKEYGRLFAEDPQWQDRAERFAARIRDFSEFLVELPLRPPQGTLTLRVAYDAPCHLLHAQRIADPPLEILRSVAGVRLVPLQGSQDCCGAAGLYTVTSPESSAALLETKMKHILEARPDAVVTLNPGCQLQLQAGAREWAPGVKVMHLAELLEQAYRPQVKIYTPE